MSEPAPNATPDSPEDGQGGISKFLWIPLGALILIQVGMWLAPSQNPALPEPSKTHPKSQYQDTQDNRTVRLTRSLETLAVLMALEGQDNGSRVMFTNKFASMEHIEIQHLIQRLKPQAEAGNQTAQRELIAACLYEDFGREDPDTADRWAQHIAASMAGKTLHRRGRELSRQVCASCHVYPEPNIHARSVWLNGIFPWMEFMLGMRERVLMTPFGEKIEIETSHLPEQSPLTFAEWTAIRYFYLREAPAKLPPLPPRGKIAETTSRFQVIVPKTPLEPSVAVVNIDPANRCFYASDDGTKKLHRIDANGKLIDTLDIQDVATRVIPSPNGPLVALAGDVYNSDAFKGSLLRLDRAELLDANATTLLTRLRRPVELAVADLNADGREDLVICEFGFNAGRVCWWEQEANGTYTPHELLKQPGGINVRIHDFNGDQKPDIALVIAQAREGIHLFLNQGGSFERKDIRLRHPAWGYSHLEVVDFDKDGDLDLLVTNGDNGDIQPPPLRPYHGIRLLVNDGDNNFEEAFFWPQNGAFGALPEDFDGDGDMDILAISYFPNYTEMEGESLVYLENQGGLEFKASTFPENITGRWLVMDKGDLDGDGDVDVVLGAFNEFPGQRPMKIRTAWKERGASLLILRNTTR